MSAQAPIPLDQVQTESEIQEEVKQREGRVKTTLKRATPYLQQEAISLSDVTPVSSKPQTGIPLGEVTLAGRPQSATPPRKTRTLTEFNRNQAAPQRQALIDYLNAGAPPVPQKQFPSRSVNEPRAKLSVRKPLSDIGTIQAGPRPEFKPGSRRGPISPEMRAAGPAMRPLSQEEMETVHRPTAGDIAAAPVQMIARPILNAAGRPFQVFDTAAWGVLKNKYPLDVLEAVSKTAMTGEIPKGYESPVAKALLDAAEAAGIRSGAGHQTAKGLADILGSPSTWATVGAASLKESGALAELFNTDSKIERMMKLADRDIASEFRLPKGFKAVTKLTPSKLEPVTREEAGAQRGFARAATGARTTRTLLSGLPDIVQRTEEPGAPTATTDKPHGIYTSPEGVDTHADLGGETTRWRVNQNAKVMTPSTEPIPIRQGAIDSGAGVHAAKGLLGDEQFNSLLGMSKSELAKWASEKYPGIDFSKYYDRQEILEAIGGTEARKQGYDIIHLPDKDPAFTETVLLTERAASRVEQQATGAGARQAGVPLPESELSQLGGAVRGATESARQAGQTPSRLRDLPREPAGVMPVRTAVTQAKDLLSRAWQEYKSGAVRLDATSGEIGSFMRDVGKASIVARKFARDVVKAVPDMKRRDAIYRYASAEAEAGRSGRTVQDVLTDWANRSTGRNKIGYENALSLTDAEKTIAQNSIDFYAALLPQVQDAGLIRSAIDDYVRQVVKKGPTGSAFDRMSQRMAGDAQASLLNPSFSPAKQRVFPNVFEGEQAGFSYNTDFAEVAARYYVSMSKAIASRNFLKGMRDVVASDGRPAVEIVGGRSFVPDQNNPDAILMKPKLAPEDTWDYSVIDNWNFKGWKWVDSSAGINTFMEGEMRVHPEFASKMKARFEPSLIQQSRLGRGLLKYQAIAKGTLFSLSPFHQAQTAWHAVGHKVNPLTNLPSIDPAGTGIVTLAGQRMTEGEAVLEALHGGTVLAGGSGLEMFMEGSSGAGGLVSKIPGIGKVNQWYSDMLFHDYIPKLKFKTYQHILDRNFARYGRQLTREQLVSLSSDQANAAFGGLNYFKMGRSKTAQDISRLLLTAPDFLEARGRFAGQAAKGYGREQWQALLTLGGLQYVSARVLNSLANNGDAHWDPKDAFAMYYGGKKYAMRSVPSDIMHLVSDPRGFVQWRLNPFTIVPVEELVRGIEMRTGMDVGKEGQFSLQRKISAPGVAEKTLERMLPIGIQRFTVDELRNAMKGESWYKDGDAELLHALLQAAGVTQLSEPKEKKVKEGSALGGLGGIR